MSARKVVVFHIGQQVYGIDMNYISAIERVIDVVNVPNAPRLIEGIINLRGDVIPVYSIRRKFGLPDKEKSEDTHFLITRSQNMVYAFEVDSVDEIIEVKEENYHNPPKVLASGSTSYMDGVVDVKGELIISLQVDRIMSDSEVQSTEELLKEVNARK